MTGNNLGKCASLACHRPSEHINSTDIADWVILPSKKRVEPLPSRLLISAQCNIRKKLVRLYCSKSSQKVRARVQSPFRLLLGLRIPKARNSVEILQRVLVLGLPSLCRLSPFFRGADLQRCRISNPELLHLASHEHSYHRPSRWPPIPFSI